MNIINARNLACPIDGKPLQQDAKQWFCEAGHSFDIARQGYINLLPVQHKRSRQPGDSKAMVIARTGFLDSGIYQPIANTLSGIVLEQMDDMTEHCLLDAGCGEGYYLDTVVNALCHQQRADKVAYIGLDISKDAIIQATKRNKQVCWIVGTNRQPPLLENSVDIILCLFGFLSVQGFNQVLKPGGKIILLDPGADHLKELREIIYPQLKASRPADITETKIPDYSVVATETLRFNSRINDNEQINHLLLMTPHFYRASKQGRDIACHLQTLEITVDVVFRVYQKKPVLSVESA